MKSIKEKLLMVNENIIKIEEKIKNIIEIEEKNKNINRNKDNYFFTYYEIIFLKDKLDILCGLKIDYEKLILKEKLESQLITKTTEKRSKI